VVGVAGASAPEEWIVVCSRLVGWDGWPRALGAFRL